MQTVHLYIKIHDSGLKYFGRTIQNPYTYKGSGTHWLNHIKKYGNNVKTIVIASFDSKDEKLKPYATQFSRDNGIVESKEWANKIEEQGVQEYHSPVLNYRTNDEIIEICKGFNTIKELRDFSASIYGSVLSRGIKEECFGHMKKLRYGGVTDECLKDIAKKYNSIKEFMNGDNRYYYQAYSRGILKEITSHIVRNSILIAFEDIKNKAQSYNYIQDFIKDNNSMYVVSKRNGWFEKTCGHLKHKTIKWNNEMALETSKKYQNKRDFNKEDASCANYCRRNGIYDVACSHMTKPKENYKTIVRDAKGRICKNQL